MLPRFLGLPIVFIYVYIYICCEHLYMDTRTETEILRLLKDDSFSSSSPPRDFLFSFPDLLVSFNVVFGERGE